MNGKIKVRYVSAIAMRWLAFGSNGKLYFQKENQRSISKWKEVTGYEFKGDDILFNGEIFVKQDVGHNLWKLPDL